jgi:hypothetical protein
MAAEEEAEDVVPAVVVDAPSAAAVPEASAAAGSVAEDLVAAGLVGEALRAAAEDSPAAAALAFGVETDPSSGSVLAMAIHRGIGQGIITTPIRMATQPIPTTTATRMILMHTDTRPDIHRIRMRTTILLRSPVRTARVPIPEPAGPIHRRRPRMRTPGTVSGITSANGPVLEVAVGCPLTNARGLGKMHGVLSALPSRDREGATATVIFSRPKRSGEVFRKPRATARGRFFTSSVSGVPPIDV